METIVLGGGCFWCLEAAFKLVLGVKKATSGYAGGETKNPTYKEVCSGETGHAEVVEIQFDPKEVCLREILNIFFKVHDPTTVNRQGNDVGTQYRSVIFYQTDEQEKVASEYLEELETRGMFEQPIVTQLLPLEKFWPAEEYHQDYYEKHPNEGYCQVVVAKKVEQAKKAMEEKG